MVKLRIEVFLLNEITKTLRIMYANDLIPGDIFIQVN